MRVKLWEVRAWLRPPPRLALIRCEVTAPVVLGMSGAAGCGASESISSAERCRRSRDAGLILDAHRFGAAGLPRVVASVARTKAARALG